MTEYDFGRKNYFRINMLINSHQHNIRDYFNICYFPDNRLISLKFIIKIIALFILK